MTAAGSSVLVVGPEQALQAVSSCASRGSLMDRADDAFVAMERLASGSTCAVFVWTASLPSRAEAALAGMRQMLAPGGRLVLIARPDEEPLARSLLGKGADDYLIWPLHKREVSQAMGIPAERPKVQEAGGQRQQEPRQREADTPPAAVPQGDIAGLAEVLRCAETNPSAFADRLAVLVSDQLRAGGCTVELSDATSVSGQPVGQPVLSAELDLGRGLKGRLAVGPRRTGAYSAKDSALLEGLAAAAGVVYRLAAAGQYWQREAQTDELTGLVNRRGLIRRLPEILEISRRQRTTVTLLLFDIDDFKHYNDAYSHDVGDEILRETSQLFTKHTRQHDIVARYGGDEFVVVFWEADEPRKAGSKPPRDVLAVLSRYRKTLELHEFRSLGPEAQGMLTISGGLVTFPWDAATPEELISRADDALLQAKRQGKNRIWLVGQGASDGGSGVAM